jgi:hypothetical protein
MMTFHPAVQGALAESESSRQVRGFSLEVPDSGGFEEGTTAIIRGVPTTLIELWIGQQFPDNPCESNLPRVCLTSR